MIGKAIDTTRPGAPRSQPAGDGGVGSTHHRPRAGTQAAQMIAFRRPVGRRSVGGALAQREAQRMLAEKVTALAEAQTAAVAKMITGRGMAAATKSASAVYRRKVRANQRRLARR